ncbi:MAG: hypothetical protein A3J37_07375 [Alphaproteobacteria bacterium RIFCSPHIGHO2_12_FULL_45_9]|nr:MAG: hypothetical protein A3B66_08515 [Alphaproteobacteria bacterium RIFCSPHIGHO2_02_FULL_46_13]OFW95544.1 MAG: hypothetical protein A3J37_07375 [Alphaproteobacteria bacterium RIFCSPHIGHO2_12_FULL_45_9]
MKKIDEKMLENDIKAMLIEHLRHKQVISSNSVLINEFNIDGFTNRADLVIAEDDGLFAYEIKSESDTLQRLEKQVEKYSQFFDKVIVVAATKHIPNVLSIVSSDIAVWEVTPSGFKVLQRGRASKSQERENLLRILNVKELKRLAVNSGRIPDAIRRSFLEAVLSDISYAQLRKAVIEALRERYYNSSMSFWQIASDCVKPCHITELSPYLAQRRRIKMLEQEQKAFWDRWHDEIKRMPDDPMLIDLLGQTEESLFGEIPDSVRAILSR